MNEINLYIIGTSFQLLNALEAKNCLPQLSNSVNNIFITNPFCKSIHEFELLLQQDEWNDIIYPVKFRSRLFSNLFEKKLFNIIRLLYYKLMIKIYLKNKKICSLIIGNYTGLLTNYVLQNFKTKEVIVVDDGLGTLKIAKYRKREIQTNINHFWFHDKNKPIIRKLFGIRNIVHPNITFFSIYNIKVPVNDTLLLNKFDFLKSDQKFEISDNVYIIGQPVVEVGIIDINSYLNYLRKITDNYNSNTVFYIPHRRENENNLNRINKLCTIKQFNVPVELALTNEKMLPKRIIGFTSSALLNLKKIFNHLVIVESYFLPPIINKSLSVMDDLIFLFQENGIIINRTLSDNNE
ncbi:MAG: hypothetical protein A2X08_06070 [Bacteroidetes bacterium GWA2_32_17]|nr:MAG: hypothetical protein A2X08_06070 [Bacteroidetes bacterium GWA2_32_17]